MSLFDRLFGKKQVATAPEAAPLLARSVDQPIQVQVDWSNSEIHLLLLSRFLTRQPSDSVPAHWESTLGEPPELTVKRYIKNGLLVASSLKATVEYFNTGADLKRMLKERGLKVSGKKQELAERLLAADEAGMSELHSAKMVIECSSEIRPRVSQYVADKAREFDDAIATAQAALHIKDFAKASLTIGAYESKQLHVLPPNDMSIPQPPRKTAADVDELKSIFTLRPKILSELAESEWEQLHIVAALSHLLHGRLSLSWLPDGFIGVAKFDLATTVRMMQFHIKHLHDIKRMRAIGVTQGKILCCNSGSCDECREIADKLRNLDSLPELPYEKCTCAMGCRCCIVAKIVGF